MTASHRPWLISLMRLSRLSMVLRQTLDSAWRALRVLVRLFSWQPEERAGRGEEGKRGGGIRDKVSHLDRELTRGRVRPLVAPSSTRPGVFGGAPSCSARLQDPVADSTPSRGVRWRVVGVRGAGRARRPDAERWGASAGSGNGLAGRNKAQSVTVASRHATRDTHGLVARSRHDSSE